MRPSTSLTLLAVLALAGRAVAAPHCEPRPLNDWRLRCAADRDEIDDSLASPRRSRSLASLESVGEACRVLAASGGPCAQARAELLAILLNVGAGRLNPACCVQAGDSARAVTDLIRSADDALADGCAADQCERISRGLRGVNDRTRLIDCPPAGASPAEAPAARPESADAPAESADVRPGAPSDLIVLPQPSAAVLVEPAAASPAAEVPPGTCCDPRTADAWARACTLSGKWTTLTQWLDSDNQRDFGVTTCAGLRSIDLDEREQAKRQLIALRLNVRSGYLAAACPLTTGESVEQAGRRAFELRRSADSTGARDVATDINSGRLLAVAQGCATPQEGQDLIWQPPPPPAVEPAVEPAKPKPPAPRRGKGRRG